MYFLLPLPGSFLFASDTRLETELLLQKLNALLKSSLLLF